MCRRLWIALRVAAVVVLAYLVSVAVWSCDPRSAVM